MLDFRSCAGDLLGETQAGHMKWIGTDLYQHRWPACLDRADRRGTCGNRAHASP